MELDVPDPYRLSRVYQVCRKMIAGMPHAEKLPAGGLSRKSTTTVCLALYTVSF